MTTRDDTKKTIAGMIVFAISLVGVIWSVTVTAVEEQETKQQIVRTCGAVADPVICVRAVR